MSQNPTFDDVLGVLFKTMDLVYQIHEPETEEENATCTSCQVVFPCETADILMAGIAATQEIIAEARENVPETPTEAPETLNEETPTE